MDKQVAGIREILQPAAGREGQVSRRGVKKNQDREQGPGHGDSGKEQGDGCWLTQTEPGCLNRNACWEAGVAEVYLFPGAALANYHNLGGLKQ